ncbi:MAG: hypothetical protein IT168_27860 [Bryobacterales bacterium]|nr:hypothetical protein [Bryobacterales bacterium]
MKHTMRLFLVGVLLGALSALTAQVRPLQMKLLVLAGDGTEPGLSAIRSFLDSMGVPYEAVITKTQAMPALSTNNVGNYQGIILTTGNLSYYNGSAWVSGLTADQWTALDTYQKDYKVRAVSYYTWPEARYGLEYVSSTGNTSNISFTTAAAAVFPYVNRNNPVSVENSWTYLSRTVQATGEVTTPILLMGTNVVGVLHTKPDGREYLALTMDNNPNLRHSNVLNYGLINWVTKGVFLGFRKIFLTTQSDDLFLPNDLFVNNKPACQPVGQLAQDPTYDPTLEGCPEYRITGAELSQLNSWQNTWRNKALTRDFQVSIAFNGYGTTAAAGTPANDSLTTFAKLLRNSFIWINHTYDHENLDCYDAVPGSGICPPATAAQAKFEIDENIKVANALGLPLDAQSMVTPNISGLANAAFLKTAADSGIRYLVSDTSRNDYLPQRPNEGVYNSLETRILLIPRRATSMFYNTISGKVNVAGSLPDEYNFFYGPNGVFKQANGAAWFNTTQTYAQIIDRESDFLLSYMLRYEIYPTMYHQSNFTVYQGSKSLFSDLMDAALTKYGKVLNLPIVSMTETEIGQWLQRRMVYNRAGVNGIIYPGQRIELRTGAAAQVPITGICKTGCESYGTERISYANVTPGSVVTIPLP